MELSEDTRQVLEFLDYTSGGSLRKRNDLGAILEILATKNNANLANDLIFYGSALWGSYRIIKTETNSDLTGKIKSELENLFEKMFILINQVVELFNEDELIERFERVYLKGDSGSRLNLIDLCYDLNELKKVQIRLKNK